jgi:hypothetical protein
MKNIDIPSLFGYSQYVRYVNMFTYWEYPNVHSNPHPSSLATENPFLVYLVCECDFQEKNPIKKSLKIKEIEAPEHIPKYLVLS